MMFAVSQAAPGNAPEDGEVSHQFVFYGIASRRTTGGNSQLGVDRAHVEIDGDNADDELLGNQRTRQALCEQTQHFSFARGEGCGNERCRLWRTDRRLMHRGFYRTRAARRW